MTEGPSSYLDWIVPHGVTQFFGPTSIGKTSVLQGCLRAWPHNAFMIYPGVGEPSTYTDPVTKRLTGLIPLLSVDQVLATVGSLSKKGLDRDGLLLVDDTAAFACDAPIGTASKAWSVILRHLHKHEITTVVSTQARPNLSVSTAVEAQSSLGMKYSMSAIYEMQEIARSAEGVVIEVLVRKSKREMAGGVKGRLWVRPGHEVPVRTT